MTGRAALTGLLLFLSLFTVWSPVPASAENLYRILDSQPVLGDDGEELGREVRCACYSTNDRIIVWRIEGGTPISPNLDQESDFDGTLWLYYVGNRSRPQIAVHFHRVDRQLTADIYDDQTGDGGVAFKQSGREITITESDYWSLRIVARDDYWQRDGRLALNFDLMVDSRMEASFGGYLFDEAMKNDGQPDVEIEVRGPTDSDPRSYDWRNVHTPFPISSGIYRTTLMVRERGEEPAFDPMFPWYLMGATGGPTEEGLPPIENVLREGLDSGLVKPPGRSAAPIQVDWALGRIVYVAEFVASRGSDNNWFTYSIKRVEPDALTNPDFESPFAFYDLANDQDNYPELSIRAVRFDDDEPASAAAPNGSQGLQMIRYSWDQNNDTHWSFKLGLLGRQSVEGRVTFPDFELQTIPYAELPTWVTQQPWEVVTFVAAERPLWTSEGIYDWDFVRQATDLYSGNTGMPRDTRAAFTGLADDLRGDYSLHLDRNPVLTFNPIDGLLHLEHAEGGIWNLPGTREIRFLNLAQGPAIDGWQYWNNERLISQLYRVPNGLIYSDQDETLFLKAEIPNELFHASPPANHKEWVALGSLLESNRKGHDPNDLRAMFDQFDGAAIRIANGPLSDFQHVEGGVQFAVSANDETTGDDPVALLGNEPEHSPQIVTLVNNEWSFAEGSFTSPTFSIDIDDGEALRESSIEVAVVNQGTMAIDNTTLEVTAVAADGRRSPILAEQPVTVEGADTQVFDLQWAPRAAGNWTLEVVLHRPAGSEWSSEPVVLAKATQPFKVRPQEPVTVNSAASLGWPGVTLERLGFLLGLAGVAGAIAMIALVRQRRTA